MTESAKPYTVEEIESARRCVSAERDLVSAVVGMRIENDARWLATLAAREKEIEETKKALVEVMHSRGDAWAEIADQRRELTTLREAEAAEREECMSVIANISTLNISAASEIGYKAALHDCYIALRSRRKPTEEKP